MARQVYSKLKIAGVDLTLRSDDALSVTISKVPASSDLRRTVNGDLVNLSRSVFDKLAVSISGSGINTPPLSHLSIGGYTEVLLPDPVYLQSGGSSRATYPRALVDVEGFTISGQKIMPIAQPPNRVSGMSITFSSARRPPSDASRDRFSERSSRRSRQAAPRVPRRLMGHRQRRCQQRSQLVPRTRRGLSVEDFVHFSNERLLRVPSGPSTYEVMRAQIVRMRDAFTSFEARSSSWPFFLGGLVSLRLHLVGRRCVEDDDRQRRGRRHADWTGGILVTIEIACRAPDHTSRVTAALAPVRARLGKHLAPEDGAALLELGMVSLYTDPVTHAVARTPFGGNAGSVIDLYGEGAAAGQSEVFAIDMLHIAEPATSFTLEANARHVQQYTGLVDIDVPQFEYYGGTVPSYFKAGTATT
ncbi:hypothetical protein FLP41_15070 [Paracoccus marcusii]|uniref:hypothetical protein n=1 Tax=Paracoccus marcusii TaxID=59779 RepID=UPI002ED55F1D|nr:hypothetical protein FLP41_15070 [Paracoccus marcusii]